MTLKQVLILMGLMIALAFVTAAVHTIKDYFDKKK